MQRCSRFPQEVEHEIIQNLNSRIGEFVLSQLCSDPAVAVVSGSVVLDSVHGTNVGNDIDFFCVRDVMLKVISAAKAQNFVVHKYEPTGQYLEDQLGRYQIMLPDEKSMDVVVCIDPRFAVGGFDLSANKIAYCGKHLWASSDWSPEKITRATFTNTHTLDRFIGTMQYTLDPELYRMGANEFGLAITREILRMGKYAERGYRVLDMDGRLCALNSRELATIRKVGASRPQNKMEY